MQQVLKRQAPWRNTYFYQKSEVLYHLTYVFCKRFLPAHGDRTVDQMIQAARSGKQNISSRATSLFGPKRTAAIVRCRSFAKSIIAWRIISHTSINGTTRRWQT